MVLVASEALGLEADAVVVELLVHVVPSEEPMGLLDL